MQPQAAKWILKTSEMRSFTSTATLGVVEHVSALVEFVGQVLKSEMDNSWGRFGCNLSNRFQRFHSVPILRIDVLSSAVTLLQKSLQLHCKHLWTESVPCKSKMYNINTSGMVQVMSLSSVHTFTAGAHVHCQSKATHTLWWV